MTLETFFEKFDHFAKAPNFVAKMRELVLQLAVQGKLVPQDVNEEPAETMLYRIASTTKSRFHIHGSIDEFEPPFEIPSGWMWVKLPHVLKKLTDGTHHSPPNGPSGDFKYVTAKNIKTEGIRLDDITYVSKQVHEEIYSRCDPSVGDVLYIKDGATTGIATINQLTEPFSMLSSVALLKPSEALFNRYLLWAMRSPFFYDETRGAMKGVAITRVTLSVIAASVLPLPPLAEQKRIVAKVDELMALCDQLEMQQRERDTQQARFARTAVARFAAAPTPENIELLFHKSSPISPADLRKTILTFAVQGKLVPQDPNDEPAAKLLKRIEAEKAQSQTEGPITSKKLSLAVLSTELPFPIPNSWQCVRFLDYATDIATGPFGSILHQSDYVEGGVPLVNPSHMINGRIVPDQNVAVSLETANRLNAYKLHAGDIVMARRGEVGRAAVVYRTEEGWLCGTGSFFLRFAEEVCREYLMILLRCEFVRKYLAGEAVGITMGNLNHGILKRMPLPIPPLAEQRRIVAKVDQLMALVDQLEMQLAASRATATTLMEAIVAELTEVRTKGTSGSTTDLSR